MLSAATLVRITGADPRLAKAHGRAFFQAQNGVTAVSASGIVSCTPGDPDITVYAPASVLLPFIQQAARAELSSLSQADLLPSVRIEAHWEGVSCSAELVQCFEIKDIQTALTLWLNPGDDNWALGWALGHRSTANIQAHVVELACRPLCATDLPAFRSGQAAAAEVQWGTSTNCAAGSPITAVGSPFGVMSPKHFTNTCVHGMVSNCWPAEKHGNSTLLMADMRCLPGMEGGPVFDQHGQLVAVTMLPLLSTSFNAEVPLLMPIQLLVAARTAASKGKLTDDAARQSTSSSTVGRVSELHQGVQRVARATVDIRGHNPGHVANSKASLPPSQQAQWAAVIPSVVLISAPSSGWASGIVISRDGFILTNAHVVQSRESQSQTADSQNRAACPSTVKLQLSGSSNWQVAEVVYIFKHVLDLAVLRIRAGHNGLQLQPAVLQPYAVQAGQPIAVVGHALFSPGRSMPPTRTTGNVSKVVYSSAISKDGLEGGASAAMLLTTATVHAGASGGAVVNADAHVVGITTSNARHASSGSTIPNLNFAVAVDALRPLWHLAAQPEGLTHPCLQQLDIKDAALSDIWTISKPPEESTFKKKPNFPGDTGSQGPARLAELLSKGRLGDLRSKLDGAGGLTKLRSTL